MTEIHFITPIGNARLRILDVTLIKIKGSKSDYYEN